MQNRHGENLERETHIILPTHSRTHCPSCLSSCFPLKFLAKHRARAHSKQSLEGLDPNIMAWAIGAHLQQAVKHSFVRRCVKKTFSCTHSANTYNLTLVAAGSDTIDKARGHCAATLLLLPTHHDSRLGSQLHRRVIVHGEAACTLVQLVMGKLTCGPLHCELFECQVSGICSGNCTPVA